MFVAEALYSFSSSVMSQENKQQSSKKEQQPSEKKGNSPTEEKNQRSQFNLSQKQEVQQIGEKKQAIGEIKDQDKEEAGKRERSYSQQKQLQNYKEKCKKKTSLSQVQEEPKGGEDGNEQQHVQTTEEAAIQYLEFQKGDKILVIQSYENGWWYGHTLSNPEYVGFFPSNYVEVAATKSKPPPPPPEEAPESSEEQLIQDSNTKGIDWVQNQLKKFTNGPVDSSYYLGIKGYRNVKIDEKNQNILKGNNVKFDVNTGLAKVPIKDQAPAAKSVRQMGYYFDYHQWTEERNKNPNQKARPDIRKKKPKTLKLKGMD